ncbi:MAG: ATP-binding protein [Pseudodesulfovibrio sp.]|uniref:sensor histidine kinase n=1 Tax=Pseudodesulfovibrio sp. TaxID=2035812 RepID=UPI003D0ADFAE
MARRLPVPPLFGPREYFPSLAAKILLSVFVIFLVTSVTLYFFYSARIREQGMENLRNQLEAFASSKAAELSEPLWNFQDVLLESLMRSYRDNGDLHRISLYDNSDKLVMEETPDGPDAGHTILTTARPLTRTVGGEVMTIGRLVVQYHDDRIRREIAGRRHEDLGSAALLALIVFVSGWFILHLVVGRPLQRLKLSLRHNARSDARMPLVWNSRDELGEVVAEYNNLLREVEHQTSQLVKKNAALEKLIAQRREAERKLARAHDDLEQTVARRTLELREANKELVRLDNQRSAFLSSASHELRTPLAAVLGFSKLVRKEFAKHFAPAAPRMELEKKSDVILGNLDIIAKEGDRLTRLINDLLDINKIEAGQMEWRDTLLNVPDELNRALRTMAPQLAGDGPVRLETDIPEWIPPLVFDPDRMQQLLLNLLSNAYKNTDSGTIRLTARHEGNTTRIAVSDTGRGIPERDLELIFHKFHQSENGRLGKPGGTGLGLAICRHIVDHYGGRITVESKLGHGSTFTVELPAQPF